MRSIEEVAEDMLRTLEELRAQQRGGQSPGGSQPERGCGKSSIEESPREWDLGGLSSKNQWNPRESEGTSGAEEGSGRAKTTEFSPLPTPGAPCQGTYMWVRDMARRKE